MTRVASRRVALSALLAVGGAAGAQDLAAYGKLAASLDAAAQARTTSAPAALAQLDRAQEAFQALSPTLRNQKIVTGLNDTLSGARAALARTPAELQAQVALARGLMRKALYDQTLSRLAGGEKAGEQVALLSREFGLADASARALAQDAQGGQPERVAWRLQRAAVTKVNAALAATQPQQDAASYLNLARATGWFTVVQDAAGVGELSVTRFGDALRQLTSGDVAALRPSLAALRSDMKTFTATLATAPGVKPVTTTTPPSGAVKPDPAPVTAGKPGTTGTVNSSTGTAPTGTNGNAGNGTGNGAASARPPAGTASAAGSLGSVYAALGRALSEVSHANAPAAREQIALARAALNNVPNTLRNAAGFGGVAAALDRAAGAQALRPQTVQALIGQVANLEREAAGQPLSALDRVSGVASGFGGWVRALLFAVLAALAAAPLYLLNLAFGGRNTSWRAVGAGLALLLLPVFLEGLFGLLGALGDLLNVGPLRSLTNFTLFQGAYGLPLWWLLSAGALGLLSAGFWGLCQQFGLLGQPKTASARNKDDASIDWDEDF